MCAREFQGVTPHITRRVAESLCLGLVWLIGGHDPQYISMSTREPEPNYYRPGEMAQEF